MKYHTTTGKCALGHCALMKYVTVLISDRNTIEIFQKSVHRFQNNGSLGIQVSFSVKGNEIRAFDYCFIFQTINTWHVRAVLLFYSEYQYFQTYFKPEEIIVKRSFVGSETLVIVFNKEVLFLACNQHKTSDIVFIINVVNASLTSRLEEAGIKIKQQRSFSTTCYDNQYIPEDR